MDALQQGKIIRSLGGFYRIRSTTGEIFESRARGVFRHQDKTPLVGDDVVFRPGKQGKLSYIEKILPRHSQLLRPPVANVDQLLLLLSVERPKTPLDLGYRLTVRGEWANIPMIIVLTKEDLAPEEAESQKEKFEKIGYPVIALNLMDKKTAREILTPILSGKISALAGVSAAGKSTLTNLFVKDQVEVGEVSKGIHRGKHTTRHSELYKGEHDIWILDTPGFSSLELQDIPGEELKHLFPEFNGLEGFCRFSDCNHVNEPGCKVKEKLEAGKLQQDRYDFYVRLMEEKKGKRRS